jgi:hypothetical protein
LFQDLPYGCGILISTTFPVGTNNFNGRTSVQRCSLDRCGGYDSGYGWRAALQLYLDHASLSGITLNNLHINNSVSDGLSIMAPGSSVSTGLGTLSNAVMANVSIPNYGIGVSGRHGLWARSDAIGSMMVSNSPVAEYRNDSTNFSFSFGISAIDVLGIDIDGIAAVTLAYATTPGVSYHVEFATNLYAAAWAPISGSTTHAIGNMVTFTDSNAVAKAQRFYRIASP